MYINMDVFVNGKKFSLSIYDDYRSLLDLYSLKIDGSLPSFFYIAKDEPLVNDAEIHIEDIREALQDLDEEMLLHSPTIDSLLLKYPYIKRKDIAILWILEHYDIKTDVFDMTTFKLYDKYQFTTFDNTKLLIQTYIENISKQRHALSNRIIRLKDNFKELDKLEGVAVEPFILENTTTKMVLDLPENPLGIDIFDNMDTSRFIPFIMLIYKGKRYFKVYQYLPPLNSWIEEWSKIDTQGLYFKILNSSSKKADIEKMYATGTWTSNNIVKLTHDIDKSEGISEDLSQRLINSLGGRLKVLIVSTWQTNIGGIFRVLNFDINKTIIADLITNNPLVSFFMFLDEHSLTVNQKAKELYVYYKPDQQNIIKEASTLRIVPYSKALKTEEASFYVRLTKVSNVQQIMSIRAVFSKILSLYKKSFEKISNDYISIIPDFKKSIGKPAKIKAKVDKKTGKRLQSLKQIRPDMFVGGYSIQCAPQRQPYIVKEEDLEEKAKELGDPHKIMFFEGSYFACQPRDPDDEDKENIWPGLKRNKNKNKKNAKKVRPEWMAKYPLIPCCYKDDQYIKKAAPLAQYTKNLEEEGPMRTEKTATEFGYVLLSNSRVGAGRYGELPFNWNKIIIKLGYEKVDKSKQSFYPILRHGVLTSVDSIIHCMERATNDDYLNMDDDDKLERVRAIRDELSDIDMAVSRQETYNIPVDSLRNNLKDSKTYLDPRIYVSILEKYYECNIYLYIVDNNNPDCNVAIPTYSQAYLLNKDGKYKQNVLIIMFQTEKLYFPYQSELLCHVEIDNGRVGKINFLFENHDDIVKMALKMLNDTNDVLVVSTSGYERYMSQL
jgi:hypothetical protein